MRQLATTSTLVQEKLLRVIEYGEYERVGGNRTLYCEVRLVAATNEDLPALADAGGFRHDLLDRLAFDVITLPPLRQQQDDIVLLAEHFAVSMAQELEREYFPGFSVEAKEKLTSYQWPGNVRELKNVVERCVYRHDEDSPVEETVFDPFESPSRIQPGRKEAATDNGALAGADPATPANPAPVVGRFPLDLKQSVQDYEVQLIEQALNEAKHNKRKAAELLEVTYHQLRGCLKKYELLKKD